MKRVELPVPPPEEQVAISRAAEESTRSLDRAIQTTATEIQLLEEYRLRLIADAVTGRFDAREAALRLPGEVEDSAESVEEDQVDHEDDVGEAEEAVLEEVET